MDVPTWLVWRSIAALALALASAASRVDDLWTARRQMMTVMEVVWPVTALYLGPAAVWAYRSLGVSGIDEGGGHAHAQGSQRNGGREQRTLARIRRRVRRPSGGVWSRQDATAARDARWATSWPSGPSS